MSAKNDDTTTVGSPEYEIDPTILESEFVSNPAKTPLRVCCYGSSSSKTPAKFMKEAWNLGYILAKRGHTCVNGAGSYGCMAAMNDGADAGNGHIVGVIHEMFMVDGKDWLDGAHNVFNKGKHVDRDGGAHDIFKSSSLSSSVEGPTREILIAGGDDLQERKKLLVQDADALVVLPGGPGTWDELWEMACTRNLGLTSLPIVCVSVDGFYENFREMLALGYNEGLVKNRPEDIVHFVPTAKEAIHWIESRNENKSQESLPKVETRDSVLRKTSFFASPTFLRSFSLSSEDGEDGIWAEVLHQNWMPLACTVVSFTAGLALGVSGALKYGKQ